MIFSEQQMTELISEKHVCNLPLNEYFHGNAHSETGVINRLVIIFIEEDNFLLSFGACMSHRSTVDH